MNQIQKAEENRQYMTIKQALEASRSAIEEVIPKAVSSERLLNLALLSIRKTPALQKCAISSLLGAVVEATRLGLELGGSLGHAHLVPYGSEATMIIGYRGFVELMRRGGHVTTIRAVVVHAKDVFEVTEGLEQTITHRPHLDGDPGELRYVYAVAKFAGTGDYQAVWMSKAEVDKVKARSRASASGPWVTDYEEMAKKTVVRRLAKLMPLSIEAAEAIERDDETAYDVEATAEVAQEVTRVSPGMAMKAKLAERRKLNVDAQRTPDPSPPRSEPPPIDPPTEPMPGDIP